MQPTSRILGIAVAVGSSSIAACSHATGDKHDEGDAGAPAPVIDGGHPEQSAPDAAVVVNDPVGCMSDPRALTYAPGLTALGASGKVKLTLVRADIVPPLPGTHTWFVRATDPNDQPLSSPTVTAKPWMPDHNHGTSIKAAVTPQPDGSFEVSPLYFFMPGLWQSIFTVTTSGGVTDTASFTFCVGSAN
jgi:hypothetical protein